MLDKFGRAIGIPFPGGPIIEKKHRSMSRKTAQTDIDLPYVVHGMTWHSAESLVQLSACKQGRRSWTRLPLTPRGILRSCGGRRKGNGAHGKSEILLGGGVACNKRIREMTQTMASERGGSAHWPDWRLCIDNGTMIAELGRRMLDSGEATKLENSAIDPSLRTDMTPISWS